jgi:predicted nucleic acid-binding protein
MIIAIDTNILLDIQLPNELFCDAAIEALERSAGAGSLVVCDLVYTELCVHFADQPECDEFLTANEIRVEPLNCVDHSGPSFWR